MMYTNVSPLASPGNVVRTYVAYPGQQVAGAPVQMVGQQVAGAPVQVVSNQVRTIAAPSGSAFVQGGAPTTYTSYAYPSSARPSITSTRSSVAAKPSGSFKVCVVGGAGGIGQPLSLLMAQCPLVRELAIIDLNVAMVPAPGVEADLSHIEGKCKVTSTTLTLNQDKAIDKAGAALTGCDLVLVPAGVPRKPGQDRKDLLNINCDIAKGTVEACAKFCPNAVIGLIVNPVNSVVPAMCELWKKAGLNPKKIVGISTLDVVRANKFVQEITGRKAEVPVIGGHAGKTILPLFSQDPAGASIAAHAIPGLDTRVQDAGTEVVKAKNGKGSATLSMAYSGARLGKAVLSGLAGVPATECAYVESSVQPGCQYFASRVVFGRNGIEHVLPIGNLSAHESTRLRELVPILQSEIADGLDYAKTHSFDVKPTIQSPTPVGQFKVCVVGGAGGIGQPLSLLMASNPLVKELSIIDLNVAMVPAAGVEADLSHIEGPCKVTSTVLTLNEDRAIDKAGDALTGCHLVLVPAGVPRKPGQDRKDLLNINCDIAKGTVEACAKFCPNAVLGLIVNPVNSVVPAMCELWKKAGLNPKKIVGVSTLDVVRANKFVQEITGQDAQVPVIGGHAGKTILPLFSQDAAGATISQDRIPDLDARVQDAGTEVVKAKNGKGSATLSMAYSGARLGQAVLSGLAGVPATECAYVESSVQPGCQYFASKVVFGREGIQDVHPVGELSQHEAQRLAELVPILQGEIADGLSYAASHEFAQ